MDQNLDCKSEKLFKGLVHPKLINPIKPGKNLLYSIHYMPFVIWLWFIHTILSFITQKTHLWCLSYNWLYAQIRICIHLNQQVILY